MYAGDDDRRRRGRPDEGILDLRDLARIRRVLRDKPRDLLLFDLATHTGLEMKQLLRLKVKDFLNCRVGQKLVIDRDDGKTSNVIPVTETVYEAWRHFVEGFDPSQDEFLFKSRKGNEPLTLSSVSHLVGSWFEAAGLKGLGGARALRRTRQPHFEGHEPVSAQSVTQLDPVKALAPIQPVNTLQETVYQKLFEAIVTGRITPGERLLVDRVAAQMNVSRMPVREALHRLHEAGLVSLARRRSTVVNKLSVKDLREITRIRLILECEAAEEGARRCSDESLRNLEAIHRKWVKVDERRRTRKHEAVAEYLRLNRQFHHAIYSEARMPILMQIITGLWDRVYPYLHILLLSVEGGVGDKTVAIHQGMLDGMKRRDSKEVLKWVREDLSVAAEGLIGYLERFEK